MDLEWQGWIATHILTMEMRLGLPWGLCDHCLYVRGVVVLKEARADSSSRPIHTGLSRSTLLPRESGRALSSAVGKIQEPMFQPIDAPTSCVTLARSWLPSEFICSRRAGI